MAAAPRCENGTACWDTVLPADSVECLPLDETSCIVACGCYRLGAESGVRVGRLWLGRVRALAAAALLCCGCPRKRWHLKSHPWSSRRNVQIQGNESTGAATLALEAHTEIPGVLDLKWCARELSVCETV